MSYHVVYLEKQKDFYRKGVTIKSETIERAIELFKEQVKEYFRIEAVYYIDDTRYPI